MPNVANYKQLKLIRFCTWWIREQGYPGCISLGIEAL